MLLTSLAVAVFSPSQYLTGASLASLDGVGLADTYAVRPLPVQIAFYVHIVSAGIALLVGGFQFSGRLRRRRPAVHRWVGRTYVYMVYAAGASGLVMACFSSVAFTGFFGFGTLAILWVWTTYRGRRSVRNGDIASHQAWMIRSFALAYAAPTLRLWLLLLVLVQIPFGVPGEELAANAYAPVAFLCWLPNIVVAEIIIKRRGLPSVFVTPSDSVVAGRGERRGVQPA